MAQFSQQIVGLDLGIVEEISRAMRAERRYSGRAKRRQRLRTVDAREGRGDCPRECAILRLAGGHRIGRDGGELAHAAHRIPLRWCRGVDKHPRAIAALVGAAERRAATRFGAAVFQVGAAVEKMNSPCWKAIAD